MWMCWRHSSPNCLTGRCHRECFRRNSRQQRSMHHSITKKAGSGPFWWEVIPAHIKPHCFVEGSWATRCSSTHPTSQWVEAAACLNCSQRTAPITQLRLQLGNANPVLIFQTRVYGFDLIQTRVPGFDIWWVTCQWQARKSCTIYSYAVVRWRCGWLDT